MKLKDYKIIFITIGLIGILIISYPLLTTTINISNGNRFSELSILGSNHSFDNYPYNILVDKNYSIFLDVQNHEKVLTYYVLYLKFCNCTNELPADASMSPSFLEPLHEYKFILPDEVGIENLLTFSFNNVTFSENQCVVQTLVLNGFPIEVNKPTIWNAQLVLIIICFYLNYGPIMVH